VLAGGMEESVVVVHVPTASGCRITMELDMLPIEKAGSATSVLLQLSDITEKKQLEQQLIRSERLASLSQFASMFAHDIRNPLAGIKKTLELLGHRKELQAKPVSRFFEELHFTTELLLGMINDMLDVYQESYAGLPLVSSTFSVGALLQEVAHLFRLEAESKDVIIRLSLPAEEVTFVGDRRRFQRVGINLVHNALKFSPPKGIITLSAQTEREAKPDSGFAAPAGPVLVIQIEDEGPGLDSNELPHLFEMFFRKKDGRDLRIGRGLGLHFCRLVVEAHGGRIWAANRPTGGAVFSMALPLNGSHECRSGL
jgi:signal transduction histidine kinase